MANYSQPVRTQIVDWIIKQPEFYGPEGLIEFINNIWPLRTMPSTDSRYKDAMGDFRQHLVNNGDWQMDEVFYDKLNIHHGDESRFIAFVEAAMHPANRQSQQEISRYLSHVNSILQETAFALRIVEFSRDLPVYKLRNRQETDIGFVEKLGNTIPFFKAGQEYSGYPCFSLVKDNWNDYGYVTSMQLFYSTERSKKRLIGVVKILCRDVFTTWDELPDQFLKLPPQFCSLGTDEAYYFALKDLLPDDYESVLYALRDAALFPAISDQFYKIEGFQKSLIRENYTEVVWRTMRFRLANVDIKQAFKFSFQFRPIYSEDYIFLDFDFRYDTPIEHRIYALIGKNGAGKTKILSTIAQELASDNSNLIGKKPLYGKILSISYSFFDNFEIPKANENFYYSYCGLKKDKDMLYSREELNERLDRAAEVIEKNGLLFKWMKILSNFIDSERISQVFNTTGDDLEDRMFLQYNPASMQTLKESLSSGQHILFYVLTELIAQIRENTLILFDEPETHLHPNAISELMNSLQDLVREFKSFCIIGTHSPLVIQCIQSRNVFVLKREPSLLTVEQLERESFGENLTIISEDIFGAREIEKRYLDLLPRLKNEGRSFDEILQMLEAENGLPANLNTRLYLKGLFR